MAKVHNFNVFLGGNPGVFLGVNLNSKASILKHNQNIKVLDKKDEISAMSWGDAEQNDILIGTKEQNVKIYDTDFKAFASSIPAKQGTGPIVGISRYEKFLLTAAQSGDVKLWTSKKETSILLETKKPLDRMRHFDYNSPIIATGGKNNDLRIWDINEQKCLFQAKNVPKDKLQLEVPIWVSDMTFLKETTKIAISSRHGHIRLYDTRANQRPVISHHKDDPFICISSTYREEFVLVGSGTGRVYGVDFRNPKKTFTTYKGPVGSVRSIAGHPTKPYAAITGLDRFLRLYDLEKKSILFKEYAKFQFNCVLLRKDFCLSSITEEVEIKKENSTMESKGDDFEVIDLSDDDDDKDNEKKAVNKKENRINLKIEKDINGKTNQNNLEETVEDNHGPDDSDEEEEDDDEEEDSEEDEEEDEEAEGEDDDSDEEDEDEDEHEEGEEEEEDSEEEQVDKDKEEEGEEENEEAVEKEDEVEAEEDEASSDEEKEEPPKKKKKV